MPITNGPQIAISQIHAEVGGTGQASLNDADIRGLIGKASGAQMAMSEWYGASAPAAYRSVSTGAIQGTTGGGLKTYSLTSLGAQQGDLVIVATCQDGPGTLTPYQMSGWTALVPNGFNVTFVQDIYWKVMGSSPESEFKCTLGPYYFSIPVVALCIKNVGTLTASTWNGWSYSTTADPPSRNVANAGSVGIVVLCRDDNAAGVNASTPTGYTKIGSKYTSNAGIGYNWEQSVDIYYRLNLPTGTHDPSLISWYNGYDNSTATTAIFY